MANIFTNSIATQEGQGIGELCLSDINYHPAEANEAYSPLEEPLDFASPGIDIHPSKGWIGAGSWHKANSTGARTEKLSPRIYQHITDR